MKRVLIAGVGDISKADRGVGPFAVGLLMSQYNFSETVQLLNLGIPSQHFFGDPPRLDAVILIESSMFGAAPGDIRLYRKQEILRIPLRSRTEHPWSALRESLAELKSLAWPELLLISMQGGRIEAGARLSRPVRDCIPHVLDAVLRELRRLNVWYEPKPSPADSGMWWNRVRRAA